MKSYKLKLNSLKKNLKKKKKFVYHLKRNQNNKKK